MALRNENVIELCISELQSMRTRASANCRYTQEMVCRAIIEQTDEACSMLEQCFNETVRAWIHSHPSSKLALHNDTEENYIAQTFFRFRYAIRSQQVKFSSLPAALSYLHATLNGVLIDTLRFHFRLKEVPLPEADLTIEPSVEEAFESEHLWESVQNLLCDERERRLFYLLYSCGLKPRDIVTRCPQEFPGVKEIYRMNKNIVERLRYLADSEEEFLTV